jgi:hypothetical protein
MPRPQIGLEASSFKLNDLHDLFLSGHNLRRGGEFPTVKLRAKRHFWKNPVIVEDGARPSSDTLLHIRSRPKAKAGGAHAAGFVFDGSDDLNITLTWNEGFETEHTETFTFEDIEYTPPDP